MKQKAFRFLLLLVVVMGVASTAAPGDNPAPPAPSELPASESTPGASTSAAPVSTSASMVVAKDPVTGRLKPATAAEFESLLTEELRKSLSTSTVGLVEVESPTPGGGVMLDLQSRFRNYQWATRDSAGTLRIRCRAGDSTVHESDGSEGDTAHPHGDED